MSDAELPHDDDAHDDALRVMVGTLRELAARGIVQARADVLEAQADVDAAVERLHAAAATMDEWLACAEDALRLSAAADARR